MEENTPNENVILHNIIFNLVNGISFKATQVTQLAFDHLFEILRNNEIKEFTFNNQWFNKSAIASVYAEVNEEPKSEPCCV